MTPPPEKALQIDAEKCEAQLLCITLFGIKKRTLFRPLFLRPSFSDGHGLVQHFCLRRRQLQTNVPVWPKVLVAMSSAVFWVQRYEETH